MLSPAMMVSEEKRVPTNTSILIVHGQGRQWPGQVGLALTTLVMAWKPPGTDSLGRGLYPHSPISGLLSYCMDGILT